MATYLRGKFWWYRFRFAGERIDEPTKSTSRTVAKEAERQHRRTLEAGYNNFKEVRQNRVRILEEIIDEYLTGYRLRYRSASFAEYALGHVGRLLGTKIVADITDISVLRYQEDRLREKAAPKSINEEVRFLLKMLGDPGDVIRAHLQKTKQLKLTVHKSIGKAFNSEETESLATKAKSSRSPHMYPAFMLARNGGLRDTEIKTLTWSQINFVAKTVQVGRAKSEAGEGRIVPLNSEVYQALIDHCAWYRKRFGEIREEWYVFPYCDTGIWAAWAGNFPARGLLVFFAALEATALANVWVQAGPGLHAFSVSQSTIPRQNAMPIAVGARGRSDV